MTKDDFDELLSWEEMLPLRLSLRLVPPWWWVGWVEGISLLIPNLNFRSSGFFFFSFRFGEIEALLDASSFRSTSSAIVFGLSTLGIWTL